MTTFQVGDRVIYRTVQRSEYSATLEGRTATVLADNGSTVDVKWDEPFRIWHITRANLQPYHPGHTSHDDWSPA